MKKWFIVITSLAISLIFVLIGCAANANSSKIEESSESVIVPAPEATSDISPQVETAPIIEPDPEDAYTYYDVPFDLDTQKEIIKICSEFNLSYELVLGVISVESTFRPDTMGDGGNSYGLMQIQPRWWRKTMEREGVTDLLDPLQNVRCGCAILRELLDKHGTEYRALQAYNTGRPNTNNGYAERVYRHRDRLTVYGG